MQRLRLSFRREESLKYISHLDMMRLWQRILLRAGIAMAYTEGFNPRPRLAIASPLALGVIGMAELLDVFLKDYLTPYAFEALIGRQLPEGIGINQVFPVPLTLPSLQAAVRFAEYETSLRSEYDAVEVERRIGELMARTELPWQHYRDTGPRQYDLRKLVEKVNLIGVADGLVRLRMKLRCDSGGSGRPEQVCAALGFDEHPEAIARTRLVLQS